MAEQPTLASLLERLESATDRLESIALASSSDPSSIRRAVSKNTQSVQATVPAAVENYDQIISGPFKTFLDLSNSIGDLVKEQSTVISQLFQAQRQFVLMAAQSKRPEPQTTVFSELILPMQQAIEKIIAYREDNRGSPFFNHLSTVSEGISAFGWVTVEPAPAPYIGEMKESAQFYANRVIKEFKDSNDNQHATWARSFIAILSDLQNYVKAFHTTGLVWNPEGGDPREILASLVSPTSGKRTRPPVPPRHDRVTASNTSSTAASNESQGRSALFSALNRGEAITSGLRKVDKSETSQKSTESHSTTGNTAAAGSPAALTGKKAAPTAEKPPKTTLEGNRWSVENHTSGQVILDKAEQGHAVYVYQCSNCTITFKNKVNAITMDKCRKVGVVIDSTISNVEIINSQSVQVQVLGHVPTVNVDTTDGAQLYLGPEALDVQLLTSKSSSVNLLFPDPKVSDYVERPIPEQLSSRIVDGKVITEPVLHS